MAVLVAMHAVARTCATPDAPHFASVHSGKLKWLQPACVISHLIRSWALWCVGIGLAPNAEAIRTILERHIEVVLEIGLAFQDQMPVPLMMMLHAFRQAGWMSIVVWCMGGDPFWTVLRGIFNWCIVVLLTCACEWRTRILYKRQLRASRQQEVAAAEPRSGLPWPVPQQILESAKDMQEFRSDLPEPVKAHAGATSSSLDVVASSSQVSELETPAAGAPTVASEQQGHAPEAAASVAQKELWSAVAPELPVPPAEAQNTARPAAVAPPSVTHPFTFPELSGSLSVQAPAQWPLRGEGPVTFSAAAPSSLSAEIITHQQWPPGAVGHSVHSVSPAGVMPVRQGGAAAVLGGGAGSLVPPVEEETAGAGVTAATMSPSEQLRWLVKQRNSVYARERRMRMPLKLKMEGLELEDLPHNFPYVLRDQMQACMPGVALTGVALRSGCVMMSLDMLVTDGALAGQAYAAGGGGGGASMAAQLAGAVSKALLLTGAGPLLATGAGMSVQTPEERLLAQWQDTGVGYDVKGPLVSKEFKSAVDACMMLDVVPRIHSLLDVGVATAAARLHLTVQLQLPDGCHLCSWDTPSISKPKAAGGSSAPEAPQVYLLVRQVGGGYLPVTLVAVQAPDAAEIAAEVVVCVQETSTPVALYVELWCQPAPQDVSSPPAAADAAPFEVLVEQQTVLVLPATWHKATPELQRLLSGETPVELLADEERPAAAMHDSAFSVADGDTRHGMDGVTAGQRAQSGVHFLDDLGAWVGWQTRSRGGAAAAVDPAADAAMRGLGSSLLVYSVQHSMATVAEMMVSCMEDRGVAGAAQGGWKVGKGAGAAGKAGEAAEKLVSPCSWLEDACTARPGLLHAAMVSGRPDILRSVLRWGAMYGGPNWSWPWELEDESGCTALHLAAAQAICQGLLQTLVDELPLAQQMQAQRAWLQCSGGVGASPAEWSAQQACGGGGWASLTGSPSRAAKHGSLGAPKEGAAMSSGSWVGRVVETLRLQSTRDYYVWTLRQTMGVTRLWAATLVLMGVTAVLLCLKNGTLHHEWPTIFCNTFCYIPILLGTSGVTFPGNWKVWLLLSPLFHSAGFLHISGLTPEQNASWSGAVASYADVVYQLVILALCDPTPLPWLIVTHSIQAYFYFLAYVHAGVPHAWWRTVLTHVGAVVVSAVGHRRQLHAYIKFRNAKKTL